MELKRKVYVITTLADLGDGAEVYASAKETLEEAQSMMKELLEEYAEENDMTIEDEGFYIEDMKCEYSSLDDGIYVKYEIHECYL